MATKIKAVKDETAVVNDITPDTIATDIEDIDISTLPSTRPAKTFRPSQRVSIMKQVKKVAELESLKDVKNGDASADDFDGIEELLEIAEDVLLKIAVDETEMETWILEASMDQLMAAFMKEAEHLGKSLR